MEENKKRRVVRKPVKKKSFFEKYSKIILGVFVFLFLVQTMRGCVSSASYEKQLKHSSAYSDSIYSLKDEKIAEQDSLLEVKDDFIQYLEYELKIAGIKVQAADERAKAVQSTAEKVKNNNTSVITIKTDTTANKITQE